MKYPIGVKYEEGGPGSDNFGHSGRPGQRGGSGKSGSGSGQSASIRYKPTGFKGQMGRAGEPGILSKGDTGNVLDRRLAPMKSPDREASTIRVSPGSVEITPSRAKRLERHLKKIVAARDAAGTAAEQHGMPADVAEYKRAQQAVDTTMESLRILGLM